MRRVLMRKVAALLSELCLIPGLAPAAGFVMLAA